MDTLFALFMGILLGTGIASIYLTNSQIIVANSPLENLMHASSSRPMNNQTNENHDTISLYNPRDEDLIDKCSNLTLPLTTNSPKECWPRLIILPSHATSGSKLFQDIWDLFGTSMSQYYEPPRKIDKLFTFDALDIYGSLDAPIPFDQPIVFQSHITQSKKLPRRQEMNDLIQKAKDEGLLRGIIRMARNPGDQLIRNAFRWGKKYKYCKDNKEKYDSEFDCFVEQSKRLCRRFGMGSNSKTDNTYNIFHQFWSSINLGIPETTIHYERMTSKDGVTAAIESIIYFMNQNDVGYNATTLLSLLKQKVDQVKSMVKEPDYKQGTLVAQVCGIEVATKVHKKTRAYSEALGYVFDKKSGHWSLQE